MESGAILVDKPAGITSSGVVTKIKWAMQKQAYAQKGFRIGHGGTLDPFATGVLLILFGEATKLADTYLHSVKAYDGLIALGSKTDTGDLTGEVTESKTIPKLSPTEWTTLASSFSLSPYLQVPPMYSAKKINGVALHSLARQGVTVDRQPIEKKIFTFEVSSLDDTFLKFEVSCESGTYIRVLAEDLALKAGTLAHLQTLRRTRSSDCDISSCCSFDELLTYLDAKKPLTELRAYRPIARLASHLPTIELSADEVIRIRQGSKSCIDALTLALKGMPSSHQYTLGRHQGETITLFEKLNDNNDFRLQRVFN